MTKLPVVSGVPESRIDRLSVHEDADETEGKRAGLTGSDLMPGHLFRSQPLLRGNKSEICRISRDRADADFVDEAREEITHNPPTSPYVNKATTISYTFTPGTPAKNFFHLKVTQTTP
jgi:hypothetical protein